MNKKLGLMCAVALCGAGQAGGFDMSDPMVMGSIAVVALTVIGGGSYAAYRQFFSPAETDALVEAKKSSEAESGSELDRVGEWSAWFNAGQMYSYGLGGLLFVTAMGRNMYNFSATGPNNTCVNRTLSGIRGFSAYNTLPTSLGVAGTVICAAAFLNGHFGYHAEAS